MLRGGFFFLILASVSGLRSPCLRSTRLPGKNHALAPFLSRPMPLRPLFYASPEQPSGDRRGDSDSSSRPVLQSPQQVSSGGDAGVPPPQEAAREKKPLRPPPGTPLREKSAGGDTLTIPKEVAQVGDPQQREEKSYSIETILKELQAIQNTGPRKYCILGTRHCSYLHQQIIELLSYALVLTGNHIFTSGSPGTNAAAIRGALRAERPDLLTVVLPQSLAKQPDESQELLEQVEDVIENGRNDVLSLDVASRICNSDLLSRTEQLIAFAFHDSGTVIEATREAKSLEMVVTTLYLD